MNKIIIVSLVSLVFINAEEILNIPNFKMLSPTATYESDTMFPPIGLFPEEHAVHQSWQESVNLKRLNNSDNYIISWQNLDGASYYIVFIYIGDSTKPFNKVNYLDFLPKEKIFPSDNNSYSYVTDNKRIRVSAYSDEALIVSQMVEIIDE